MSLKIKELVKDKFWIVESSTGKVGTIRQHVKGYEFFDQRNKEVVLLESIDNFTHLETVEVGVENANKTYLGYPTNSSVVIPVEHESLPVFKKTENGKSYYTAGYYILRYHGMGWQHAFCPKLDTIEKYEYQGPFLTEWDMNLSLRKAKKSA